MNSSGLRVGFMKDRILETAKKDQKKLKKIFKSEGKHSAIYTFSAFLTKLGSFLVVPLFWQKLSPGDYGIIAITEIIASLLSVFMGLSLESSINRFYYEWSENERKHNIGTVWVANWLSTIAIGFLSLIILSYISQNLFPDVPFKPYILMGIMVAILQKLNALTFCVLRIKRLPWLYSSFSLLNFILIMSLSIYYILMIEKGLYGYFIANIISGVMMFFLTIILMTKVAKPCFRIPLLKRMLSFSLPMVPAGILGSIATASDKYLLQYFVSVELLGIYAVSLKFVKLIKHLHIVLKLSFVPFMVKDYE